MVVSKAVSDSFANSKPSQFTMVKTGAWVIYCVREGYAVGVKLDMSGSLAPEEERKVLV